MGLFDSFTGASQRRDIDSAYNASTNQVNAGYRQGMSSLSKGRDAAISNYGNARGALTGGRDAAIGTTESYLNRATAPLQGYADQGSRANTMYSDALGINGRDAQTSFVDGYQGDPFRDFNEQRVTNALMRQYNAAGMLDSGASRLAASRANLERGSMDYNQYLDRLAQQGQQGGQYASQIAGYTNQAGQQIGGYQYGTGQGEANIYGQQAGTEYDYGNQRAGMQVNRGMTLAGNRINYGNALADSRSTGINNLLKIGETAAKAYSGGMG